MIGRAPLRYLLAGLALIPALALADFNADTAALASGAHRLSGTPEYAAAAAHVERRLREIGVDEVIVHDFPSVQTFVDRCEVEVGGTTMPLIPCRPNGIAPPFSPPGGWRGPIYQAGLGRETDFAKGSPEGCIVVLDYRAGDGWLRAFRMGARAVIVVKSGPVESSDFLHVTGNVNLPRYFHEGAAEDFPEGAEAVIHSQVVWKPAIGRNIYGIFRGSEPQFYLESGETMVVATPLDSFGEVPRRSPGARGAANAAGLLKVAERLAQDPPRRNVVLAFFDNEARGHAGAAAFYTALETEKRNVRIEERRRAHDNETRLIQELRNALAAENPLAASGSSGRDLIERFKEKAKSRVVDGFNQEMSELRAEMKATDDVAATKRIEAQLAEREAAKKPWNDLRRAISARVPATPETAMLLAELGREISDDLDIRQAELDIEERSLDAAAALRAALKDSRVNLHLDLLFGDATKTWAAIIGGDSDLRHDNDRDGLYGRVLSGIQAAVGETLASSPDPAAAPAENFLVGSTDLSVSPTRALSPLPKLTHSGEIAGKLGIYNLILGTVQEPLEHEGTPDDRVENLDLLRLEGQFDELASVIGRLASREELSLRSPFPPDARWVTYSLSEQFRVSGTMAMGRGRGSSTPDKPMAGAILRLDRFLSATELKKAAPLFQERFLAYDDFPVSRANQNGGVSYGPVRSDTAQMSGFAVRFDGRGTPEYASDLGTQKQTHTRVNMFRCHWGGVVIPPQIDPERGEVYDAQGNSKLEVAKSYHEHRDGMLYWYCEDRVDRVKYFGTKAAVGLHIGDGPAVGAEFAGNGFAAIPGWEPPPAALRSAHDLWALNEARLDLLRKRGIINSSTEEMHGRAYDYLEEAVESDAAPQAPGVPGQSREALATASFLTEVPAYEDTKSALDDLVRAVLVLLALCVPFSFALERLLIGSSLIHKQIAGFVGFFAATFLLLYFSHPAFAISQTPLVIFLGFTILVLSVMVIFIIMQKFESELKVLQGMSSTVHSMDVSRFGTIMAAMAMGISTMRRRPLRTALTAITILLLTFTILCFASFGSRKGVIETFDQPSPRYSGVAIHHLNWSKINTPVLDLMRGLWNDEATVAARTWVVASPGTRNGVALSLPDGTRPAVLRALVGIDRVELENRPDLRELFGEPPASGEPSVWLTRSVANALGVQEGETILAAGVALTVRRLLDPSAVLNTLDLDGSAILPVDFESAGKEKEQALAESASDDNWTYLPVDSVAFATGEAAAQMGATLRGINIYTEDSDTSARIADETTRMLRIPITGTRGDGVYVHRFGTTLQASGAGDLVFPIILGGLVIFGTMLGSVADREREIYTFSALGLAPPHVASLFFAEALVYSVIGGLGGYLFAQGLMLVLEQLAAMGLMTVPEINYSSTNAIFTLLIVMATVLVSAIYPALRASRSANPGVLRTWKLPPPDGDTYDLTFPFTVSAYDITGVVAFLEEHFESFRDSSLGSFLVTDCRLIREGEALGIEASLAIAPFDLGVTQTLRLRSAESEIEGIDEVRLLIKRKSGQPGDWRRLNKVLLDDLRKQFLIWRSLPRETMEIYRKRTLETFSEDLDPTSHV